MRLLILIPCFILCIKANCQQERSTETFANVRLSFLLFPFTPLLTIEVRTLGPVTLQFESNFVNTHGVNLKCFLNSRMDGNFVFTGIAWIENKYLRTDEKPTFLPYVGFGNAYRFGNSKRWTFDNRIGIGSTTNADNNSIYPVLKTGLGFTF